MNTPPSSDDSKLSSVSMFWVPMGILQKLLRKKVEVVAEKENSELSEKRENPVFKPLFTRPLEEKELYHSAAVQKMLEITIRQILIDTNMPFSKSAFQGEIVAEMKNVLTGMIKQYLPPMLYTLDNQFYSTYQEILKLHEAGEDVDEYMKSLEDLQKVLSEIPIGDYIFLMYDVFKNKITDKGLRNELKKLKKTLSWNVDHVGERLKFLDISIGKHYKNKELREKREKQRIEALERKNLQYSQKVEKSFQENENPENLSVQPVDTTESDKVIAKIQSMYNRLQTIEERVQDGIPAKQYKKEVLGIEEKFKKLSKNLQTTELLEQTHHMILNLLSEKVQKIEKKSENAGNADQNEKSIIQEDIEINSENIEFIHKIDDLLEINHSISNTKNKSKNSHGDGSFVTKIFRPFLRSVKVLFEANKFSFKNEISWGEIIEVLEKNHDDFEAPNMHFRGIVKKKNTKTKDVRVLLLQLHEAVEEFSESSFAHNDRYSKTTYGKTFLRKFMAIIDETKI